MIIARELSKVFTERTRGEITAVDSVSFTAAAGQITGLLGQNGAGKSTLLRMLATVVTPTSGDADINGFSILTHPTEVRRQIGFMSASTALYGRMSPRELLAYFAELYGLTGAAARRRIDELIARLAMESFADGLCDKLSTGQKQRVSIARTLLHDPQVMFFDEPTSGLDVIMSQEVMSFVEEERRRGKTIVYCTHVMSEIERLCDSVICIHEGKVKGVGTVAGLKQSTGQTTVEQAFLSIVGYDRMAVNG